jgi:hypothetical protein
LQDPLERRQEEPEWRMCREVAMRIWRWKVGIYRTAISQVAAKAAMNVTGRRNMSINLLPRASHRNFDRKQINNNRKKKNNALMKIYKVIFIFIGGVYLKTAER